MEIPMDVPCEHRAHAMEDCIYMETLWSHCISMGLPRVCDVLMVPPREFLGFAVLTHYERHVGLSWDTPIVSLGFVVL